ncbi:adrenoceptor alpha [Nesidiocoris tenuis]|uniref:Adrenoceptor alpha n=1 Tax=Nesidiocoris tenuis TaxID=355587 RepID=A0ABN7AWP5_9HEMI|nr:adrenoceptor alpha [Nesidiocoris tenuis]
MLSAMADRTTPPPAAALPFANNGDLFLSNASSAEAAEVDVGVGPLVVKALVMGTIIIAAVLGNALVIISVVRHRKLRIITNYYVVSLAMADLLVALCAMTFNASVELSGGVWMFGPFMCDVWNSLDVYFSTASILHLCCISVDRYYAIVRPLQYPITMTHRTVSLMLANVWTLPALISFTPIFLGWYTTPEHARYKRDHPDECAFVVNNYYAIVSSCISFWIPGIVMITMYYRIYKEAVRQREALSRTSSNIILNSIHQHRRGHPHYTPRLLPPSSEGFDRGSVSTGDRGSVDRGGGDRSGDPPSPATLSSDPDSRHSSGTSTTPLPVKPAQLNSNGNAKWYTVPEIEGSPDLKEPPDKPSVHSPRQDHVHFVEPDAESFNSNKRSTIRSASSWRTEHKAARTLGIIMGVFLLCWLPFFLWYVITSLCGDACYCPDLVVSVLFWIGYFNSALNPLIYAYFNRDFREAFKNTLICVFPCCFTCCPKAETPVQYV